MVTISTIILALTLIPIIVDGLLGLIRGRNRSILRLILVIISAVIAILAIKPIIGSVMSAEVEGQPLKDFVASQLLQGGSEFPTELADLVFMIIEMFVSVILYFVVFLVVKFITWLIVFPILKIFVKKGEHTGRLAGLVFGLLQGIVVAFLICAPITGLVTQVNKFTSIDTSSIVQPEEGTQNPATNPVDNIGLEEYIDSSLYKIYSLTGGFLLDNIAYTTDANGNKVTLTGTVDAFISILDLAEEAQNITTNMNILLDGEPTAEDLSTALKGLGGSLVAIGDGVNSLDDSSKNVINSFISVIGDMLGQSEEDIPQEVVDMFKNFDVNNLKLSSAGHAISGLASYFEKTTEGFEAFGQAITQDEVNAIVNGFADNPFILTMIAGDNPEHVNELIEVNSSHAEMFENAISSSSLSEEQKEIIRKLFAL